jgi:hypothetical protein
MYLIIIIDISIIIIGAPTACNSYDTLILIKLACNGKSSCDPITSSVTNIACPSSFALNLWVQWECVDSSSYKTTISSQNITDSIDYCSDSSYVPLDSCPTQSVLVPSLLIDSKTTNFDYPIYQHIACYNAKLHIQCQAETIIHIYAVYYGIQSETSSDCVSRTNLAAITAEAPAQCWSPLTYDRVAFLCEYKTSCLLTSSAIGLYVVDICPDYKTRQQLLVQYQCIDLILFNQTVGKCNKNKSIPSICPPVIDNEGTWCDNTLGNGAIMKIDCPAGTKIKIVCGFYGIHPSISTCNLQSSSSPVCYFNSSFSHLSNLCNGKNSCSINDFASIFLDPCGGLDKTLYVQWNCT